MTREERENKMNKGWYKNEIREGYAIYESNVYTTIHYEYHKGSCYNYHISCIENGSVVMKYFHTLKAAKDFCREFPKYSPVPQYLIKKY